MFARREGLWHTLAFDGGFIIPKETGRTSIWQRKREESSVSTVFGSHDARPVKLLSVRRKTAVFACILLLGGLCVLSTQALQGKAQGAAIPKEKVEWTWSDHSDTLDAKLPNILLVGDSITRAYFPEVAKRFAGKANVYLFATSCSSGDPRLNAQLHMYFETAPSFRVIHFNNGMHGWDYSETAFAAGLPGMIHELKKESPGSKLIWATITPVRKDNSQGATNERIDARNVPALAVMKHDGIPVDDQHALMEGHGDLHLDDVHFNDKGSEIQGDQAAESIDAVLASSKTLPSH